MGLVVKHNQYVLCGYKNKLAQTFSLDLIYDETKWRYQIVDEGKTTQEYLNNLGARGLVSFL
jgi:hypothetical protein